MDEVRPRRGPPRPARTGGSERPVWRPRRGRGGAVVATRGREARVVTLSKVAEEGRIALVSRGGWMQRPPPSTGRCCGPPSTGTSTSSCCTRRRSGSRCSRWTGRPRSRSWRVSRAIRDAREFKAFLFEIDATEEDLTSTLRRSLRVRRYLESRLGRFRPAPREVEAWYRAHASDYGGRTLAEAADEIAARLASSPGPTPRPSRCSRISGTGPTSASSWTWAPRRDRRARGTAWTSAGCGRGTCRA